MLQLLDAQEAVVHNFIAAPVPAAAVKNDDAAGRRREEAQLEAARDHYVHVPLGTQKNAAT